MGFRKTLNALQYLLLRWHCQHFGHDNLFLYNDADHQEYKYSCKRCGAVDPEWRKSLMPLPPQDK
jgi:hypothetical protein